MTLELLVEGLSHVLRVALLVYVYFALTRKNSHPNWRLTIVMPGFLWIKIGGPYLVLVQVMVTATIVMLLSRRLPPR